MAQMLLLIWNKVKSVSIIPGGVGLHYVSQGRGIRDLDAASGEFKGMLRMEKISISRKRGFTLIEVLIVVALISAMLIIGMPALISQVSHINLSRAARDVLTELNAARSKAISRNMEYRVVFTLNPTPQADTYRVAFRPDIATPSVWQDDTTIRNIQRSVDITVPAANFDVEFNPGGSAEVARQICLQNIDDAGDKMTVEVFSATGRVEIRSGC
jgi:prepilin-type N-terminal cleavage/methylation domain-containing protein